MNWNKYFPLLSWLPEYNSKLFRGDLLAGITVYVILIPQGMAYAMLAGLPPVYGLYAGIVPLFLYAFFGSSRQLSVGPVALVSLLVLSGISVFAETGSDLFISLAITTALLAGLIQVLLGIFKMGFLINFLSHPVISGFTSAAALIIGFSQLKHIMGIQIERSNQVQYIIFDAIKHIGETHFLTLTIGLGAIALILSLKKIRKTIPSALITVILGTILVWGLGLDNQGVDIVGDVPKGLPSFKWHAIDINTIVQLLPLALTICLISFIESLAIAKTIQTRHKNYEISPNQELIALGITKIGGALFQSFPTTGSFTRSAINDEAGAKTGISSMITAILVAVTLLFLTPIFFYLPKAVLAAIIIGAVINLINIKEAFRLWNCDKRDFLVLFITFLVTILLGIQEGVLSGVILSLGLMIYHNSKPHLVVLGRLPNSKHFRNIKRFDIAEELEDVLIMRFDAQLYFGNADFFKESILNLVSKKGKELRVFILDASSIHDIDSSGMEILSEVIQELKKSKIKFYIANVIGPVRDKMNLNGLSLKIGTENQFMHIIDAVNHYQNGKNGVDEMPSKHALQTNANKKKK